MKQYILPPDAVFADPRAVEMIGYVITRLHVPSHRLLHINEAAKVIGTSPGGVRAYVSEGRLHYIVRGYLHRDDVLEFANRPRSKRGRHLHPRPPKPPSIARSGEAPGASDTVDADQL